MGSFIDERGRLFGKLSAVDLLVLLLIIALAGLAYTRFHGGVAVSQVPVKMTFAVEQVKEPTVAELEAGFRTGSSVHDDSGTLLGKLVEVKDSPSMVDVPTAEGGLLSQPSKVYHDLLLSVEGQGQKSSSQISVGGVALLVGKKMNIQGPGFGVEARVIEVH